VKRQIVWVVEYRYTHSQLRGIGWRRVYSNASAFHDTREEAEECIAKFNSHAGLMGHEYRAVRYARVKGLGKGERGSR